MADKAGSFSTPSKTDKPVIVRVKRKVSQTPLDALWIEINERPLKRPLLDFEKLSISDSSTKSESSSTHPSKIDKPVFIRVKRKAFQSRLNAFWIEINKRPLNRPLVDFGKLSISGSSTKIEELRTKKIFVQHVETLRNLEVNIDILKSFVQPDAVNSVESILESFERRCTVKKTKSKQDQLLAKAKKEQEALSKSACFEQTWRRRKGRKEANHDEALYKKCHLYDVVRVDVVEKTDEVKELENTEYEDYKLISSFLPMLREVIPSAASEIDDYMSKGACTDDFVYDLYAVKDDITMRTEDASNLFPLVQLDDDDDDSCYDGPDESENESYDSNDNPLNEYLDDGRFFEEEEAESRTSNDMSDDLHSVTNDGEDYDDGDD